MPHLFQDPPRGMQTLLATELYRPIVECIKDRATIYSLLFVSPTLNYEAERALYRSISPKGRETQESLFRQLQGRERVARLVLNLHIDIGIEMSADELADWTSLSLALRALINLKSLGIWYWRTDAGMSYLLDGCQFRLATFSWPFSPDQQLSHFLQNQPQIRAISLQSWFSDSQWLSLALLPQLSILKGTTVVMNALLPGRQITHLFWDPDLFDDPLDLVSVGPALNNIRVLKYRDPQYGPPLHTIIPYIGNLEVLEWNQSNQQEVIDKAALLPNLQKIVLPYVRLSDPQTFLERMFPSVSTLRSVVAGLEDVVFFRWSRDSDIREPITLHPDDWMFY